MVVVLSGVGGSGQLRKTSVEQAVVGGGVVVLVVVLVVLVEVVGAGFRGLPTGLATAHCSFSSAFSSSTNGTPCD